jgi:hypothetical protein
MIGAAAAAAAAFNLVCSGTISTEDYSGPKPPEPYRYEYRIDLDAKKWCESDCPVLHDVAAAQATAIMLEPRKDVDTPTRREFYLGEIDRVTGRHSIISTSGRGAGILIMKWEGRCESAPFSGFPKHETKF